MAGDPEIYLLRADRIGLLEFTDDAGRRARGPVALARALTSSPPWKEIHDAVLVVRTAPIPLLAILGYFDDEQRARIGALRWQLENILPRLRYVNYRNAEKACARVAAEMMSRFGPDQVGRFRYVGLPRGGFFVLGMLSYMLNVPRERLHFPHPVGEPLVVVDDCAITGVRFREFLKICPSMEITFAHLCSHPELRRAIQAQEPRVSACISAQDLSDFAPNELGPDYGAWRHRWHARSPDAYWVGLTEHVCFPWSEPDVGVWNPVTQREEAGWRLMPPELCLKNRPTAGHAPDRLQVQPLGPGPLRPAAHVVFGRLRDQVILANVRTEETFSLNGVAADMWSAIATAGNVSEARTRVAQNYDVDETRLSTDLDRFVTDLMNRNLLERSKV
jgi:hypothetical protein